MLGLLRESVGGVVAKFFIGLLVLSFGVWGIADVFRPSLSDSVLSIGETKVSVQQYAQAYNRSVNRISANIGRVISRQDARAFGIETLVLSDLVAGASLDENARILNLGLSEEALARLLGEEPAFQDSSGNFSRTRFSEAIRLSQTSEANFIATRRSVAIRSQILGAVSSGNLLPKAFLDAAGLYTSEQRKLAYFTISPAQAGTVAAPTDEQLKQQFDANKLKYAAPEYRKIAILKLEPSDLVDEAAISDADVKSDYESRIASYTTPERRRIQQILFKDRAKGEKMAEDLKNGAFFESTLAEAEIDIKDIELGVFSKAGLPDKKLAETAFSLKMNTPSGLVEGTFGPVIVRVTEIEPKVVTPFDEVKGKIRTSIALQNASELLNQVQEEIEDARAGGATLAEVADKQKLKLRIVESIDRASRGPNGTIITDLPESAKVLDEAFKTEIGLEANLIDFGTTGYVWIDVLKITPARDRKLEEIKDRVSKDWRADEEGKLVQTKADAMKARLLSGADIATLASEIGVELQTTPLLKRSSSHEGLSAAAIGKGFGGKKGAVALVDSSNGAAKLVLQVAEVNSASATTGLLSEEDITRMNSAASNDLTQQLIGKFSTGYGYQLNQGNIETALSRF